MNLLVFLYLPLVTGILALLAGRKIKFFQEIIVGFGSLAFLYLAFRTFSVPDQSVYGLWFSISELDFSWDFQLNQFSRFLLIFLGLFTLLTTLFSTGYLKNRKISFLYYPFLSWTLAGSAAIVLADNLFILLIGWEIVTLLLFYLITMGKTTPSAMSAGKSFAILGFTDVALLLAVVAIRIVYQTWNISELQIVLDNSLSYIIFFLIFIAAIAKAGAIPLHSWIPEAARTGPLPVIAFLPASLDKLLGIYLLARISLDMFIIPTGSELSIIMMSIGGITIIGGAMVALVQQELKTLLSYCAISQVGYMIMGIGTGIPVGIAGGLFHMLNHTLYKSCLFFTAGSVEYKTGTTDMNKLGGLGKYMPLTFLSCVVAAFSVSGIPPLNGFVSKWMIYQSLINGQSYIFLIFLAVAMFGSALTLAYMLKLLYGTFLGKSFKDTLKKINGKNLKGYADVSWFMILPMIILSLLCILFGLFPQIPVNSYIGPLIKMQIGEAVQPIHLGTAIWNPTLATLFILIGLIIGSVIFFLSRMRMREVQSLFIGGEKFEVENQRFISGNFFEFLGRMKFIGGFLRESSKGIFDVYNISSGLGLIPVSVLRKLHDGILSTYLAWCIIGLGILSFILIVL